MAFFNLKINERSLRRGREDEEVLFWSRIVLRDPSVQCTGIELKLSFESTKFLNVHDGLGVLHHFDETRTTTGGQTPIRQQTNDSDEETTRE